MKLAARKIPLTLKLCLTAFIAVLVPKYSIDYGPTNFLYFCDLALLMLLPAVWWESSLLVSIAAVGIVFPQIIWAADFFANCLGLHLIGVSDYMFDANIPWFTRFLSSFHLWLPFLLLWLTARLGYDRRALWYWTAPAWVVLLISYFLLPPPPAPRDDPNRPVNVNYVYGFGDQGPQTAMPPLAYLSLLLFGGPILFYGPTHFVLLRLWEREPRSAATGNELRR